MTAVFLAAAVLTGLQLAFALWNMGKVPRLEQQLPRAKWMNDYVWRMDSCDWMDSRAWAAARDAAAPSAGASVCHCGWGRLGEPVGPGRQAGSSQPGEVHPVADRPGEERGKHSSPRPLLSILIPARNEAENIGECVHACLRSVEGLAGRIGYEMIVLDDGSEDGTGEIAAAAGEGRVRVLSGRPLPAGWQGKSYACAQLAEAARGEWLLFLDADIRLETEALKAAVRGAAAQRHGLISGFPRQVTGTWMERLVVPLMLFTIVCHLPLPLLRRLQDPRFTAAHGGFMLIHSGTYQRCGGHAAIRSELVDDMSLARAVKRAGEPVKLADLTGYASMRMYHNAREVWNGYRKNLYAGLGRQPWLLAGLLLLYGWMYLLPPAALLPLMIGGNAASTVWCGTAVLFGIGIKAAADRKGRQPLWLCLFYPLSMLSLAAIAIASWLGGRKGYEWKGRRYS